MQERHPPVSVVTTVFQEAGGIDTLLDLLVPQLGVDDELLVVDGGSTDGTLERVQERASAEPRIRLVEAPGTNIPEGRNVGIQKARHDVIACTDAGCTPCPGWLAALRAPFAEARPPALVTGVYRVTSRNAFERAMAVAAYPLVEEARSVDAYTRLWTRVFGRGWDPAMPTGRSVAFTREAWAAVGGFPEDLETGEDVTYGRAIVLTGRQAVLAPDAEVSWEQRATVAQTARMYFRYGVGGARSGDAKVVGRDLARVGALVGTAVALASGLRWARGLAAVAWAVLASVPVARALRQRDPVAATLVPAALAVKDTAKATGAVVGLARSRLDRVPRRGERS